MNQSALTLIAFIVFVLSSSASYSQDSTYIESNGKFHAIKIVKTERSIVSFYILSDQAKTLRKVPKEKIIYHSPGTEMPKPKTQSSKVSNIEPSHNTVSLISKDDVKRSGRLLGFGAATALFGTAFIIPGIAKGNKKLLYSGLAFVELGVVLQIGGGFKLARSRVIKKQL